MEFGNAQSKYLHPHQPCQEGQLDHEHRQDPKKMGDPSFCSDYTHKFLEIKKGIAKGKNTLTV